MLKPIPHTVVLGAGGTLACLFSAGAIPGLELLGRPGQFRSIWVCSGSGPPGFLWGGGKSPRWIISKMLEYDFERMLPKVNSWYTVSKAVLKSQWTGEPLRTGVRDSAPLGYRIAKHVPEWPLCVKTLATCGNNEIVFTAEGVWEYGPNQDRRVISNEAAPVELGVRATATVPMHMIPVEFHGRVLTDGALNRHSRCPTTIATIHDGTQVEDIIGLVPAKGDSQQSRWLMNIGRHLAHNSQPELTQKAAIIVKPVTEKIRTLDFSIPRARKETAVLAGFHSMISGLNDIDFVSKRDVEKLVAKTQTIDGLLEWLDQREYSESACI